MNTIAYICDGHDKCSYDPYCYMRNEPVSDSEMICYHTMNPEHAKNGICEDPENNQNFAVYRECEWDNDPKYYERMPGEEL